ncbi:MAG: outer membrane protein assembly factor BamE [Desulfovibrionaceae bacterium]
MSVCLLGGCASAGKHRADVRDDSTDRVTVGTVQREIKVGMSGAEVVAALGSPNMVTSDSQRRETWVYDKVSTERVVSSSQGGASLFLIGSAAAAGASSTSQRTLTIIIKFDDHGTVRDYSYRQSSF